jgi:hypothetical protein
VLNSFIAKPVQNQAVAELFKKQLRWMLFLRVVFLTLLLGLNYVLQSAEKHIIIPPFYYVVAFITGVYIYTISSALILKFIRRYSTSSPSSQEALFFCAGAVWRLQQPVL